MSTSTEIQYHCPHCIAEMAAAYVEIGQLVVCSQCDEELLVPLPGDRFAIITGTILPPVIQPAGSGPCPHCHQPFKISRDLCGKHVRCKKCRGEFLIDVKGIPYDENDSSRWESLWKQIQQSPLVPSHVHTVVQLGELRDCRSVEYLCRLLFSIRRDRVRFLSASDPWVRQLLPSESLDHVDACCENYRTTHDKWFLELNLDPSYHMLDEQDFLADLEVALVEALVTIADPRCHNAFVRKLRSVIEHRPYLADDPTNPFHFKFQDARDQKVFELLSQKVSFPKIKS